MSDNKKTTTGCWRRVVVGGLYVCVLVLGIVFAWVIHDRTGGNTKQVGQPSPRLDKWVATQPVWGEGRDGKKRDPLKFVADSSRYSGLVAVKDDPGDIAPPKGAVRISSFLRHCQAGEHRFADYRYSGTLDDAMDYYSRLLEGRGFRRQKPADKASSDKKTRMLFTKGQNHVTISLRKERREGKIVIIKLTSMQWR